VVEMGLLLVMLFLCVVSSLDCLAYFVVNHEGVTEVSSGGHVVNDRQYLSILSLML